MSAPHTYDSSKNDKCEGGFMCGDFAYELEGEGAAFVDGVYREMKWSAGKPCYGHTIRRCPFCGGDFTGKQP